jgi:hypothetical protein
MSVRTGSGRPLHRLRSIRQGCAVQGSLLTFFLGICARPRSELPELCGVASTGSGKTVEGASEPFLGVGNGLRHVRKPSPQCSPARAKTAAIMSAGRASHLSLAVVGPASGQRHLITGKRTHPVRQPATRQLWRYTMMICLAGSAHVRPLNVCR